MIAPTIFTAEGVDTSVTAHVDGPGAALALALWGTREVAR